VPTGATSEAILARRLERHFLTAPGPSPEAVVGAMCGAHAQIPTAGELSVGIRLAGAVRSEVSNGLVRTYGPRGTVHLLPRRDLPMWCGALSALPNRTDLSGTQLEEVVAAVGIALTGTELTLTELDRAVGELAGPWAVERTMPAFRERWPRWRQAIAVAAARGVLCFGSGKRPVTYANPGVVPSPEGPRWLLHAYLRSYGPARPEHYARWLAAPVVPFDDLEEVPGHGWVVPGDTVLPAEAPRGLRLLPYFDAYGVGSHPRSLVFPTDRALHRNQAGVFPVVLVDGVVAGVWHARRAGKRLDVTVEVDDRRLEDEVERIAAFDGLTPRLTIGPVPVGPHA
jgi:hypothetical protein